MYNLKIRILILTGYSKCVYFRRIHSFKVHVYVVYVLCVTSTRTKNKIRTVMALKNLWTIKESLMEKIQP